MPVVPEGLIEDAARRFALLSDPTRLRLISTLHEAGEMSSGELAELAGVSAANTSQHLSRLLSGGIVARRREGTSIRYRIVDGTIEHICRIVCARLEEPSVQTATSGRGAT
ncbi:MAG TPA: metalloregulator ArsR/SmtB family transcription factor [Gaiellaceae bacterium]|nr:metalloregulator ArsR/SmtB family transcription factor [Gaiellaceae bacterium]